MDNLGGEVTSRVRDAIRSKLIEMKANSCDALVEYITTIVATKRSNNALSTRLKVMLGDKTFPFIKWLHAMIKQLQQVTVSTKDEDGSEQGSENSSMVDDYEFKFYATDDDSDEEIEHNLSEEDEQTFNEKKEESSEPSVVEGDVNKKSEYLNRREEQINLPSTSASINNNNVQINKQNVIEKSALGINKTSMKNESNVHDNPSTSLKESVSIVQENVDCRTKRPRITMDSDDEDEKSKSPGKRTVNRTKQDVNKSDVVVANSSNCKRVFDAEAKKTMRLGDLFVQEVDHQRGAEAFDTAFDYIQQQIGATDTDMAIIKKWRDYAMDVLHKDK